jgi:signal transduction histidine kinase
MGQLFTRFFRGWATGTNINGTGLGLALVRDLLHLYGGDIAVNSALDAGSTFCFWLPID